MKSVLQCQRARAPSKSVLTSSTNNHSINPLPLISSLEHGRPDQQHCMALDHLLRRIQCHCHSPPRNYSPLRTYRVLISFTRTSTSSRNVVLCPWYICVILVLFPVPFPPSGATHAPEDGSIRSPGVMHVTHPNTELYQDWLPELHSIRYDTALTIRAVAHC